MVPRHKFYAALRRQVGPPPYVARLLGIHVRTLARREAGRHAIADEMVLALLMLKSGHPSPKSHNSPKSHA